MRHGSIALLAAAAIFGVPMARAARPGDAERWRSVDPSAFVDARIVQGTERPKRIWTRRHRDDVLEFERCFVRVTRHSHQVGETLYVFQKPIGTEKVMQGATPDFTIGQDPGWFFGVSGNHLFVDAGSSWPRGLMAYELPKGRLVLFALYLDDPGLPVLKDGRWLSYVEELEDEPSPGPDCPDAVRWREQGRPMGFEEEVIFDLKTLKKERSGKVHCSTRM
ncbi:MAG TPA: hypothetical protein VJY35_05820 [Candidatus Eisenbacteria bacterium]|nr:hypothetical protein [Candidatus Eisenbacteria bacterium]